MYHIFDISEELIKSQKARCRENSAALQKNQIFFSRPRVHEDTVHIFTKVWKNDHNTSD